MSIDFDQFPLYDPITSKDGTYLSNVWVNALATFYQTLTGYLTQGGIFFPPLTTTERNALQSPANGQVIYNSTLHTAQYFKNGAWTSF